jgi:hypothetical protein
MWLIYVGLVVGRSEVFNVCLFDGKLSIRQWFVTFRQYYALK